MPALTSPCPSYSWGMEWGYGAAYLAFKEGRTWDPEHTLSVTHVLGEKLYLRSRNMSSVISSTDLFPGSSAGRRVSGACIWGRVRKGGGGPEFGRSAEAPGTVRRGQGTRGWRGDWEGWLGSLPRILKCQAFRLRIPGTSGMNSRLSACPSMSELCSKFQAPPPQFQRMNQQEKLGPAAWPREGAGGVAGLGAVSWGGPVCADTQAKGMAHDNGSSQGGLALRFLYSEGKKD